MRRAASGLRGTAGAAIILCSGDVAQLGERRVRNAKVGSSILLVSTNSEADGDPSASLLLSDALSLRSGALIR